MTWIKILEKEQLEIRYDNKNKTVILETCGSGLMPSYVTLHLTLAEVDELIVALQQAREKIL